MIECTRFKSFEKGYLQGFADFYIDKWGVEIQGCALYMKEGRRWLNLPGNEYMNKEGEKKYAPFLRFREKEHWNAFMESAKAAIDKWCAENPQSEPKPCNDNAMSSGFTSEPEEGLPF